MATVFASSVLDMGNLNLNRLIALQDGHQFFDNQPTTVKGITYRDTYEVVWGNGAYFTDLAGPRIDYDSGTGAITGGTVTGLFEGYWAAGAWQFGWSLQGFSVSAKAVYDAALTPSTADDGQLLRSILSGADRFTLSRHPDLAFGFGGNDVMYGNAGDDRLFGGLGLDRLKGGAGRDLLDGEQGHDTLTGEAGVDGFLFNNTAQDGDVITDFSGDLIFLDRAGYRNAGTGELAASQFQVSGNNVAQDGGVRVILRTTDKTLWFDRNGDNAGGLSMIADLQQGAVVTHDDIILL